MLQARRFPRVWWPCSVFQRTCGGQRVPFLQTYKDLTSDLMLNLRFDMLLVVVSEVAFAVGKHEPVSVSDRMRLRLAEWSEGGHAGVSIGSGECVMMPAVAFARM